MRVINTKVDRLLDGNAILWVRTGDGKLLHTYAEQPPEHILDTFQQEPEMFLEAIGDWHEFTEGQDEAF